MEKKNCRLLSPSACADAEHVSLSALTPLFASDSCAHSCIWKCLPPAHTLNTQYTHARIPRG